MAIGDKAAAKGLEVFPSNQKVGLGFQNDNKRGDELADEMTARAAADALKVDKSTIYRGTTDPATLGTVAENDLWFRPVT